MRVVIFGTGILYERNKEKFKGMNIVAFLDNDPNKQGTCIANIPVISPEKLKDISYDYVFLVSRYYSEMRKQLLGYGVCEDKIIDKVHRGIFANVRYVKKIGPIYERKNKVKILLFSHHMGLSGAPLVLYRMAEILKKNGYDIELCTTHEGELVYKYTLLGIPVTIYDDFNFTEDEINCLFKEFNVIVVNTVTLFELVNRFSKTSIPVIWWLHEEDDVYDLYNIDRNSVTLGKNIYVYGVGRRAINSYLNRIGINNILELPYGINEVKVINDRQKKEKLLFAIIGNVCNRKGHDVFVETILRNKDKWYHKAEFWIIGNISEEMRKKYEVSDLIKVLGSVDHETILNLYAQIDVVVCPSRNDPLPVVVTEGMMNKKVCIVSDMTGSADYLTAFESGLICKAGDTESLGMCIEWVLNNEQKLEAIGENAYYIYKEFFSRERFERNVLDIIKILGLND